MSSHMPVPAFSTCEHTRFFMGGGRGKGKGRGREEREGLCILFGSVSWLYFHEPDAMDFS